ncbi:DNA-directed RNA polymerase subunit delta [Peribacillus saganii]|uniref:Probable DNA-directed RNA polymerase subunit delta n=1 Tax=Peribacillus saganii TaxID=2303992 RepID=A0A372LST5_9BACI|nr:DNA-directed RNA polymerase subunit delta [Peribacillus saganii]RFU70852.1 DNA-directed RNA polymerase subunit delta [Peribacillus saganii]
MSLQNFSKEQLVEMSMIEIAYELLINNKQPYSFNELVGEIAALQGVTEDEIKRKLPQFYTDLNVDGRFTSLGENRWGLKTWYPVDQIEEEVVHTAVKPKKKKSKKAADDDLDDLEDEDLDFDDFDEDDELLDDTDDELLDDVDEVDEDDEDEVDEDDDFDEEIIDDDELLTDEDEEEEEDEDDFEEDKDDL